MRVRWRDCLRAAVLTAAVSVFGVTAREDASGFHDARGGHIDQVAIDMGPPGVAVDVEGNGKPAAVDRNGDGIWDAEGYDTPDPGDQAGACDNGIDDDLADSNGDTTADLADGVADDGCQVTLTPLEQCAEIIDDDVLNADEDFLVGKQDRASIDITVGAQPGPGGGIPADRRLYTWLFHLEWDADIIDVRAHNPNFLILASGAVILTVFDDPVPDRASPFFVLANDPGPREIGPGVIDRLTIEGNAAGIANLVLSPGFDDTFSRPITMDRVLQGRVAVSKDVDGDTVISGPGEVFRCCPASAVGHVLARSHRQQACIPRGPRP